MTLYEHTPHGGWIAAAILFATATAGWAIWRFMPRGKATWLSSAAHIAFLLLLGWCLLLPGERKTEKRTLKNRFVVAVDTSRSMTLRPSSNEVPRWQYVQEALALDGLQSIAARCEVDVYTFDASATPQNRLEDLATVTPAGESSMIRESLRKLTGRYGGVQVVGGLLLTDGHDTRETSRDWASEPYPFPLHTLALEPPADWTVDPDVRVDTVQTPRRVSIDWTTELRALVSGQGTGGQPINVQLYRDRELYKEAPVQLPDDGGSRPVVFEVDHPELGVRNYRVVVPILPGETVTNDNEFAVSVEVVDARNRLIYLEGPPRWESKYLTRALKSNRQVTPVIFLQGPGGKPLGLGQVGIFTADLTPTQLSQFKIVVLGNLESSEIGTERANSLIQFVEAGGSLVLLGGTEAWGPNGIASSPLGRILPARGFASIPLEGEFAVRLTSEGSGHPAFAGDAALWTEIPPVLSLFPDAQLTAAAKTLVQADTPKGTQPLIVSQPYGQGKVLMVLTDSLWKWQLHPHAHEARPYQRFWDQMIAWLLPEKSEVEEDRIDLFTDRDTLALGEDLRISARVGNSSAGATPPSELRCEIEGPDGTSSPYTLRSEPVTTSSGETYPGFATRYQASQPGLHKVIARARIGGRDVASDTLSFFVKSFSPEMAPRPFDATVLQALSTASGGRYHENVQALNETLKSLEFRELDEELNEYRSLWQTPWVLASLAGLAALAWIIRKVNHMP